MALKLYAEGFTNVSALLGGWQAWQEAGFPVDSGNSELAVDDLVGVWRTDIPTHIQFNEDGSYGIAFQIESFDDTLIDEGEFTLEGTLLTFISGAESPICNAGERGSFELEALEDGRVQRVSMDDECDGRRTYHGGLVEMVRIAP